ncbi:norfluorocurarine synthase 1-like [Rutidosis leptorrhynchoides]|uniref:norfluorocurarine synthase 1-like n=1 Tax=Rutidosis leptorrhynchoides TaxID=125765 RepID=UPI003A99D71A
MEMENKKHFVLVHGSGHGAWCWYKLIPLLKLSGHRVTTFDLNSCGINPKQVNDVTSFEEYSQPLIEFMASLHSNEKVVLVGHSFGGFVISLALEKFSEKIEVAIYLAAFMPNHIHPPVSVLAQSMKVAPIENLGDCKFLFGNGPTNPPTSFKFGPNYLETHLYQNCTKQDIELARMLVRENGLFMEDFTSESMLTEEGFGSVNRVYVVCKDDRAITEEFQLWMIANSPSKQVKVMERADHMVMLAQPNEVSILLQEIVNH